MRTAHSQRLLRFSSAFSIVELLIVVAVIGILGTLGVVAYNGVQNQAMLVAMQSDLKRAAAALEADNLQAGTYPLSLVSADAGKGVTSSEGVTYTYYTNESQYCLQTTSVRTGETAYHILNGNETIYEGACPESHQFEPPEPAPEPEAPIITTTSLPDAPSGVAYEQTVSATGSGTLTYAVVSGSLPDSVSLNVSSGAIEGTPYYDRCESDPPSVTYTFTVQVTNTVGSDTQVLSITVTQESTACHNEGGGN